MLLENVLLNSQYYKLVDILINYRQLLSFRVFQNY